MKRNELRQHADEARHPLTEDVVWSLLLDCARGRADASDALGPALSASKQAVTPAVAQLLDLYFDLAATPKTEGWCVAHLGQSLDGCIAAANGASNYVNGPENITHLHRMRALADAVLVGAGTVKADDPQLTTRLVPGENPVRVVIDSRRRLADTYGLFQDGRAQTLLITGDGVDGSHHGQAEVLTAAPYGDGLDGAAVLSLLRARGLSRVFIEGGGITVSRFLDQGLLNRLQITIAPMIIGSGRPGLSLPPIESLDQAIRPKHRRFAQGQDLLFDCEL